MESINQMSDNQWSYTLNGVTRVYRGKTLIYQFNSR